MSQQPDMDQVRRDAESGHPGAQYNLGVWFLNSPDGQDFEQAREWFEKSAAQNFAAADSALAFLMLRPNGGHYDPAAAADRFEKAADAGFAEAQYRLGEMYGAGLGRDVDYERSFEFFARAAQQGHAQAASQRAYSLGHGLGCEIDHLAATQAYADAATAGDPRAQCVIAHRYETGFMLTQDPSLAMAWYRESASQNYVAATLALERLDTPEVGATQDIVPTDTGSAPPVCSVETLSTQPRVSRLVHFMDAEECFHLMAYSRPFLQPSKVLQRGSGQLVAAPGRRSGSMRFADPLRDTVIRNLEQRLARYSGLPVHNGEPLTILRYGPGDEYRPHHDYFDPSVPGREVALRNGGQRVATLMTYLNDVERGGDTEFTEVSLRIPPQQGTAVLFFSVLPNGAIDPLSRHAGTPVVTGEKWLATRWIRENAFDPMLAV